MKHIFTLSLSLLTFISTTIAQDSSNKSKYVSPYTTNWIKDGAITVGGIGLTALGVSLIQNKKDLTPAQLATKTRDKVPFFDRSSAGFYSPQADDDSYIPFQASFAMPVLMALINSNERHHIGQVLVLYTETMAITGALFTMATGNIYRSRPYVYGNKAPLDLRLDKNSQRSFYAGHTAATAAATFFMAKVYQDFNPGSKATPYVWVVAASVPALVGYLRYKGGMHFLSDNILGYALGAGAGILVPQLHKSKKLKNVSFAPQVGNKSKGLAVTYRF
ncbi:MAG: PA-phosphatase [Segetibacter sp.]|nr:PA-phosphatase [Segetibacter sp.]